MRDYCKGLRGFYKAATTLLASNNAVSVLFAGIPCYMMIGWSTTNLTALPYISGFIYLILVLIAIVWLLSILCVYRVYPNLLSTTIFVYKALAHWALVSILMMLFYGWSFLPLQMYGRVVGALFPLIVALYVCGDVLVLVRRRLFVVIASANATVITDNEITDIETGQGKDVPN